MLPAHPPTFGSLLAEAIDRLMQTPGLDRNVARLEARLLVAHALGVPPAWLLAHDTDRPDPDTYARIQHSLVRRASGEPCAYITGEREFYGRVFHVTPDVLIPRPETEHLVEQALLRIPGDAPSRLLDLGTGSGCIALTLALERPHAHVTAIDASPGALEVARRNARRLGAPVGFRVGDWFSPVKGHRFDLIVANPPYIAESDPHLASGDLRFEPRTALVAGMTGLDAITRIIHDAPAHLACGGWILIEHGHDQAEAVRSMLSNARYAAIETHTDLAGHSRITFGQVSK